VHLKVKAAAPGFSSFNLKFSSNPILVFIPAASPALAVPCPEGKRLNLFRMKKLLHIFITTLTILHFPEKDLLAQISWDGGAGTTSWMDAANWSGDVLPTATSNVSIGNGFIVVVPSGTALAQTIGNNGNLTISAGATLTVNATSTGGHTFNNFAGSLTNNGTLNVSNSATANSGLLFQPSVSFINNGTINISNIGRRGLTLTGGTSTNVGTINISNTGIENSSLGDAIIFNAGGTFTNTGSIVLGPNIRANGLLQNTGTVIENSGSFTIVANVNGISGGGTFNNNGSGTVSFGTVGGTEIASSVTFNQSSSGTVTTTGVINCAGTFKGNGTGGVGAFDNTSITVPGASPGCLTFSDTYTTSGTVQIEINGATPCTEFDQLNVTGTATLGGTLALTITYTPSSSTSLTIIDASSLSGTFSSVTGLASGWTLSYMPGSGNVVLNYTVLPVELVSFEAKSMGDAVLLLWQTASETNNQGFNVQHSTDGRNWQPLGFVAGHGTTAETHHYSFFDENPVPNENYYRLRQVDFDGKAELSKVVSVDLSGHPGAEAVPYIYPNPVKNGELSLLLPADFEENIQVKLFDSVGRLLRSATIGGGANLLDVNGLAKGLYLLHVNGFVVKIVIAP
jgi:hypothetical protein